MFPNIKELKRMRIKAGLSQAELAKIVGVSQSAIAKYENGSQSPAYNVGTTIFSHLLDGIVVNEPTLEEVMVEDILFLNEDDTLQLAIKTMKENSISQIPIKNVNGLIVGTINESSLLDLLSQYHSLAQFNQEEISSIMDDPLPIIPKSAKITEISQIIKRYGGVLVSRNGRICGIITKSDLLQV